jgi:hypothetical protein
MPGAAGDRLQWFNLTIENVQPSGSGGYVCVAQNEGGTAEAKVMLVYSESVATYLQNSHVSTLIMVGGLVGSLVFVVIVVGVLAVVCVVRRRRDEQRRPHSKLPASAAKTILVVSRKSDCDRTETHVADRVHNNGGVYSEDSSEEDNSSQQKAR